MKPRPAAVTINRPILVNLAALEVSVFHVHDGIGVFLRHADERLQAAGRAPIEEKLSWSGRGWIRGALFDLGIYPAAIPAADGRVWGEVHQMLDPDRC